MKTITLLSDDSATISLFRAVAPPIHCTLQVIADWQALAQHSSRVQNSQLIVVDLQTVATSGYPMSAAVSTLRLLAPKSKIILTAPRARLIDDHDINWARSCGADAILPQLRASRWNAVNTQILGALNEDAAAAQSDAQRVTPFIRVAQQAERKDQALFDLATVENSGIDLPSLALRLGRSGGVDVRNRTYRMRTYEECFVASDAVHWIASAHRTTTKIALAIGKALQESGLIYHVAREQQFAEENFYFRVSKISALNTIEDIAAQVSAATGFDRQDRSYLGTTYPNCFVGNEALNWFAVRGYSTNEAMSIGQRLLDLSIITHVTNDHPFKASNLFYRFTTE
jgi:Domain found in Dishevelled, Egl-10, and Pleckstrin (DEP)